MSSEPPPPYDTATSHSSSQPPADPNFVSNSASKFPSAPYPPLPQQQPIVISSYAPQTQFAYPQQQPALNANHGPVPPPMHGSVPIRAVFVSGMVFGPYPTNMTCGNCHSQIVTQTVSRAGLLVWIICGALVLFGCWLGCCLIPFCVSDWQDVDHMCPNCKAVVGSYRRI